MQKTHEAKVAIAKHTVAKWQCQLCLPPAFSTLFFLILERGGGGDGKGLYTLTKCTLSDEPAERGSKDFVHSYSMN